VPVTRMFFLTEGVLPERHHRQSDAELKALATGKPTGSTTRRWARLVPRPVQSMAQHQWGTRIVGCLSWRAQGSPGSLAAKEVQVDPASGSAKFMASCKHKVKALAVSRRSAARPPARRGNI